MPVRPGPSFRVHVLTPGLPASALLRGSVLLELPRILRTTLRLHSLFSALQESFARGVHGLGFGIAVPKFRVRVWGLGFSLKALTLVKALSSEPQKLQFRAKPRILKQLEFEPEAPTSCDSTSSRMLHQSLNPRALFRKLGDPLQ